MYTVTASPLIDTATAIANDVVAAAAEQVDREARFPKEAIDALRAEGLLAAYVPAELGGGGASLAEVGAVTSVLARRCASTAMIYAMHQIQVACLVRHART